MNLRLAVISNQDLSSTRAWSGIPHFALAAFTLRTDVTVVCHSPLVPVIPRRQVEKAHYYASQGRLYLWTRDLETARRSADRSVPFLSAGGYSDLLVFSTCEAAFLDTNLTITIVIDATWDQYVSAYGRFDNLCQETIDDGRLIERAAFHKASMIVCTTAWAAQRVLQEYPSCREKVVVILPGANLSTAPSPLQVRTNISSRNREGRRRLLFVGGSPLRKGLDIAIEVCSRLQELGMPSTLDVAGLRAPSPYLSSPLVTSHGVLSKDSEKGRRSLQSLYSQADAFVFPTRAECAGIVLCEASAYGLPAIVSGIGGTPELVIHNKTGIIAGDCASATTYATLLQDLFNDPGAYTAMSVAARQRFEHVLNWNAFSDQVINRLKLAKQ